MVALTNNCIGPKSFAVIVINITKDMAQVNFIKRVILTLLIVFAFQNSDAQSNKDIPFTIITYNIRYNNPGDGINAWPLRKDKVSGLLKFHKADIF